MTEEKRLPLFEIRKKAVKITAWKNPKGISYTVRKEYFDKPTQSYKRTDSFFPSELEELGEAIKEAQEEVKKH